MHIILIQETNWIDRNVITSHHLLERLVERGHTSVIIDYDVLWPSRKNRRVFKTREIFNDITRVIPEVKTKVIRPATIQLPIICNISWAMSSVRELIHQINKRKPDIIICASLTNSFFVMLIAKIFHIPAAYLVFEPNHTMVPQKWLRPVAKIVEKMAIRTSTRVFVITPRMKQYIQKMGKQPEKIDVFASGVGEDIFRVSKTDTNMRKDLGIGENEWVLFFLGWLYDFSGLREIVNEVAANPDILSNGKLLIVGDGDIYPELCKLVESNGLSTKIILTGKRPYHEIPAFLGTADVCLMPAIENDTTREIVQMKIYEYMASGRPVVASRLPGLLAEFGEEAGIFYTQTPLEALKVGIELSNQRPKVKESIEKGLNFATQHFDWHKITNQFEMALSSLAEVKNNMS